jgi:AmiR/NasT family two-component response regulator
VVALVEDDQAEARADVLHVQVRRVVGGDGERLHAVLAAADDAHRHVKRTAQEVVPLAHQIERGRHHQRAAALLVDRHHPEL